MSNATNLFELPQRGYHSSESFWSSLFALYIYTLSANGGGRLPAWKHDGEFHKSETAGLEIPPGLKFTDVIVEGNIGESEWFRERGYNRNGFPDKYWISPDVIIGSSNKISIIEVKTIGAKIRDNYRKYHEFVDHLNASGCNAEFFYLLSGGHEENGDWSLIDEEPVLLWEDVFRGICKTSLTSCFAGFTLRDYTDL